MSELIRTELEADGLLLATINMEDRTMNVFSFELMDALDALMNRVENDAAVTAVVLTSGKSSFLAGADLVMVRGFCAEARTATHARMFDICGRLGRQFVRLEASEKPWVAAVNGLALGGGLELSMACRARVVTDDPRIQLGLPEIRWGLLPGAGGTQRLPRMVGYSLGMELLLTGRSLTPQQAVQAGLFSKAMPAAELLDEARSLARRMARDMVGNRYSSAAKFPHLDQADVPTHSDAQALAQAQRFGVSEADFAIYPAFSAIVDSVLKGARLPLGQATTLEMNQFLRLMFSPVAGRMVRTLFLERLRAERELAPPAELKISQLRMGSISPNRQMWAEALAKVKLEKVEVTNLATDTLEIVDNNGAVHTVLLRTLNDDNSSGDNSSDAGSMSGVLTAVLAPTGPYGRVMEIVGRNTDVSVAAASALSALAVRIWTLPWRSHGQTSLLQAMRGLSLPDQAKLAVQWAAETDAPNADGDLSFINVAVCVSGLAPGWTGGPLAWLWDERESQLPQFDAATHAAWAQIEARVKAICE